MNSKYDNWFSDLILQVIGTIVRTVERAVVVFWDGMRAATEHGTPSLLGFVAAVLPIIMPAPIALMTAHNLTAFLQWDAWQAVLMAVGIEAAGFVLWVSLTETLIEGGWRGTVMQVFFGAAVLVYEIVLITINGVLTYDAGQSGPTVLILVLLSLFPALSSVSYGYRNHGNKQALERERAEARADAERIRQERRQDRKEAQAMKLQYSKDTKAEQLQPFRGPGRRP